MGNQLKSAKGLLDELSEKLRYVPLAFTQNASQVSPDLLSLKKQSQNDLEAFQLIHYHQLKKSIWESNLIESLHLCVEALDLYWEENGICSRPFIPHAGFDSVARLVERMEMIQSTMLIEQKSFSDNTQVKSRLFSGLLFESMGKVKEAMDAYESFKSLDSVQNFSLYYFMMANYVRLGAIFKEHDIEQFYIELSILQARHKGLYYSFEIQAALIAYEFSLVNDLSTETRLEATLATSFIPDYLKERLYDEYLFHFALKSQDPSKILKTPFSRSVVNTLKFHQLIEKKLANVKEDSKDFACVSYSFLPLEVVIFEFLFPEEFLKIPSASILNALSKESLSLWSSNFAKITLN